MIQIENVTKRYGKTIANENITMSVAPGELAVLLGPNGAGKSTLIKSICGLLRFEGQISIFDHENHSIQAKKLLGYIPEMPAMYNMLTVWEHMEFIARAYKLDNWNERAENLLDRFEMMDKRNKLGKELSKGMQQKVSICCALLPQPKAVIFDEPLVGLDPHAIRQLKLILRELKEAGNCLMISTHMIESMEENWDTTYILQDGRIKAACKREELKNINLEEVYFSITEGKQGEPL